MGLLWLFLVYRSGSHSHHIYFYFITPWEYVRIFLYTTLSLSMWAPLDVTLWFFPCLCDTTPYGMEYSWLSIYVHIYVCGGTRSLCLTYFIERQVLPWLSI